MKNLIVTANTVSSVCGNTVSDGDTISLISYKIRDFMSLEDFSADNIRRYCDWSGNNYLPTTFTVVCDSDGVLQVRSERETREIPLVSGTCTFTNLFAGDKYELTVINNNEAVTETLRFATADIYPRTVYIPDIDNTRDIGGTLCGEETRIKPGIIYRGVALDKLTDDGLEVMENELGIRTELNLTDAELTTDKAKETFNYYQYPIRWYDGIIRHPEYFENLANALRVFTDKSNFPVYFHCAIGRDRTGTLAFLLKGLCGCSVKDIYREHLLSFFSLKGDAENAGIEAHLNNINGLYAGMMNVKGNDYSLRENIEQFLLSIGMSENDFALIRENITEQA